MMENKPNIRAKLIMIILRVLIVATSLAAFVPALNPARLSWLIGANASLFTNAISYSSISANFVRALTRGWVTQGALISAYIGALAAALGVAALIAAACVSIGNLKMKRLSAVMAAGGGLLGLVGIVVLRFAYSAFAASTNVNRVQPMLPLGIGVFVGLFAIVLLFSVLTWLTMPKPAKDSRFEMDAKYRLFLMLLPFLILTLLFAYLPLWGWRYAFFDYKAGQTLSWDKFVGIKWLTFLFSNAATRADIVRVLKNTFAMSGIGISMSWLPMAFAIFLSEIGSGKSRRVIQTLTTIPNFIGWVLVYGVAFALFSSDGFLNWALISMGIIKEGANYLQGGSHIWLKMWLWGTWKGLGWSAIIYIAGISGIDQQLYEAATVDGAGRFKRMWHITVPGLMPTFFVLLLLSISNILSNGLDQYLAFYNPTNRDPIQVLDLFVYQLGLASSSGNIPLATLVGMLKSIISVALLFTANHASKLIRGETIV